MKKFAKTIILLLLLFVLVIPTSAKEVLIEWKFYATVQLYNYELTNKCINEPIFVRFVSGNEEEGIVKEYISSRGLRVQSWNVPNDMNDLSNYSTFYREIPLEYDELYTVSGERVYADPFGVCFEGEYGYTFATQDGAEVIQKAEWLVDKSTGIEFPVFTYYRFDALINVDFKSGYGDSETFYNLVPGTSVSIPECTFTRSGYTFSCWTDGANSYNPGDTYIVPNKNVVMTAVWENDTSDEPVTPSRPITPTKPTYTCPYADISNHWANDIIKYIDKLNLVDGETETTFAPDKPMTREAFVTAMARLADVESNYVDWAINIGLLKGYGNGEYGLNDTITREQMAVFFLRFLELTDVDYEDCKTIARYNFADDEQIADWAKEAVYEMQALDLIHGKGNDIFDPKGLTTRAEGATVLYNLCKTVLNK